MSTFFPFAARIAEGAVFITGQLKNKPHLLGVARIMDYSCLFALLFSTLGFLGMAYVVLCFRLPYPDTIVIPPYISGQHTYSENPRVTMILRVVGFLGLVGLALCLAGGILGMQNTDQKMAMILRRAGVCIYAAMYAIIVPVHIGTWSYRWHLRSYRRNVSVFAVGFYRA